MSGSFEGCASCDHGWRFATDEYVDDSIPFPRDASPDEIENTWRRRQALYGTIVYPCPDCRGLAFRRWANGCFAPGHRAASCDLCREAMGEKAAKRHDRHAEAPL